MPTQPGGYRTKDGKRVPSVTTITSRFKEADGLIYWASRLALEPLLEVRSLMRSLLDGPDGKNAAEAFLARNTAMFDYKQARELAADAGTVAHEMVDDWIHQREFDSSKYSPELCAMAAPAFSAFLEWAKGHNFSMVETEKPLVSEKYRFGGTRDVMLISGKRALGDFKTSNDVYPEYLLQLAAYGILDEEAGNTIDGGYHLLKFSKQKVPSDPVRFTHFYWSQLDAAREGFLLCRRLYDVMTILKGLVK